MNASEIRNIETPYMRFAIRYEKASGQIERLAVASKLETQLLNRVYIAKIVKIVDSLDGAFLDIGEKDNAFMTKKELCKALSIPVKRAKQEPLSKLCKQQQMVLVQVSREPYQSKGALLKAEISLLGKYFVLLSHMQGVKFSKKIEDRKALEDLLEPVRAEIDGFSVIVRSQILNASGQAEIMSDLMRLMTAWERIQRDFKLSSTVKCLYDPDTFEDEIYRKLFDQSVSVIYSESDIVLETLKQIGIPKSVLKKATFDFSSYQSLLERLHSLLSASSYALKGGGRFTVDELEAFTIVDIDTGGRTAEVEKEAFAYGFNLEALAEIESMLMLRNISGVIIIDCIAMTASQNQQFIDYCRADVFTKDEDYAVHGFSHLGLLEVTRKRTLPSLKAKLSMNYQTLDLNFLYLAMLDNHLKRLATHTNTKKIIVRCEESLYIFLRQISLKEHSYGLEIKFEKFAQGKWPFSLSNILEV